MSDLAHTMRRVMGHFATGVSVVTARRADGTAVGTTVNALTSVSLQPPLLLVCLANDSDTLAAVRESERFAVNILAEHQREYSVRFAAKGPAARAHEVRFSDEHALEVPCLPESLATIACSLHAVHGAGDHQIVIGEARSMRSDGGEVSPLLFFRGGYFRLAEERRRRARAA